MTTAEANFLAELKENGGSSVNYKFKKKYRETTLINLIRKRAVKVVYMNNGLKTNRSYFLPEIEIPAQICNQKTYTNFATYMQEVHCVVI